jgi:hypothetical protein
VYIVVDEETMAAFDGAAGARRTSVSFDGGGSTIVSGKAVDVVRTRSGAVYGLER